MSRTRQQVKRKVIRALIQRLFSPRGEALVDSKEFSPCVLGGQHDCYYRRRNAQQVDVFQDIILIVKV